MQQLPKHILESLISFWQRLPRPKPLAADSWIKKAGRYSLWGIGLLTFTVLGLILAVRIGIFGDLPSVYQLKKIQNATASEVYAADGKLIGKYFIQNRTEVQYDEIPQAVIDALVATEDARFYEHGGIDQKSMMRVFFKSMLMRDKSSGGGSTISQQLAKNLFPRKRYALLSLPINKLREMFTAGRLEKAYSKEEILALYLNTVSFGENIYGIETAARRFFNADLDELKLEEIAVLVGMLKANTGYNPRMHPEASERRRNTVLTQMMRYGFLEAAATDSLQQIPLEIDYTLYTYNEGLAPYFRQHLRPRLEEWLAKQKKADGSEYNLYTDGLRIHTTLNSDLQAYAEKAMQAHMSDLQTIFYAHWNKRDPWGKKTSVIETAVERSERYKGLKKQKVEQAKIEEIFKTPVPMKLFSWQGELDTLMSPLDSVKYYQHFLHAGFMAMHPKTGQIMAWVGGIDHEFFKYDHVTSQRQVGSTFKPIVYAAAIDAGIDPCTFYENEQQTYEGHNDWSPANADGKYGGAYSMRGGLQHSVNTVSAAVMMEVGITPALKFARKVGIKHEVPKDPTMVLGTADLPLHEMVSAYATFANDGYYVDPVLLLRIEDRSGNVIKEFSPKGSKYRAMDERTADMIVSMLQGVADSGTAASLRSRYGLRNAIAGKTGTTQSQADGWFIGFTPDLVAGAWVGAEDRRVRFRSLRLGQGAKTALPIWAKFMQQVIRDPNYRDMARRRFSHSESVKYQLDCPTYRDHDPFEVNPGEFLWQIIHKRDQEERDRARDFREERKQSRKKERRKKRKEVARKLQKIWEK